MRDASITSLSWDQEQHCHLSLKLSSTAAEQDTTTLNFQTSFTLNTSGLKIMAEGKRTWDKEDDLPVYFGRPGTTDQVPRQKYGGMFCNVEGAFESKTIDFDALSVGKRSSRSSKSGSKRDISQEGRRDSDQGSICTETGSGGLDEGDPGIQIKTAAGKEILQNLDEVEVSALLLFNANLAAVGI
ncbi:hypothetical protein EOD39_20670 [Acipenser ruthenus]|uniref:Uncharacterized protein n=1 Tax=Acipenser ruthenus TaxID=7906 RepID=A0A444UUU0_ACIRT|nr:hypothetical protein EOD39_20670 [Acipenser ruthenus]